ncbi:ABC transporter permease [Nocardia panacis]|uniref:ABC transporter permease n=1 Tax=Nocardia panacis TaxID=2340916 RepID=A0A3A4KJI0_9NOCA|nr:ABC transporter permease [Nocardia panacis]RJO76814.1 ABC transporter permease [Nocardia panacis]
MKRPDAQYLRAVGLVVRREFLAQVRTKAYRIGLLITALGIVAAAVIYALVHKEGPRTVDIAVTGPLAAVAAQLPETGKAAGLEVRVHADLSDEQARQEVSKGAADVALVGSGAGAYTAVVAKSLDETVSAVLTSVVRTVALNQALSAVGADKTAVLGAVSKATVAVQTLQPVDPHHDERVRMSWVVLILLVMSVISFGVYVAIGVVEEKSSRVVELLLATIRPLQLMWGKVLGIGAAALLQVVVLGAVGSVAGSFAGLITFSWTEAGILLAALAWFILGYLLYSLLYAAAGSLVSRQEEVQGATAPLLLVIMASYFVGITVISEPDNTLGKVLTWIPPLSAFVMPIRIAAGVARPGEIAGSLLLMVLACGLVAMVAAKIYARSILHTGSRITWREAVRAR